MSIYDYIKNIQSNFCVLCCLHENVFSTYNTGKCYLSKFVCIASLNVSLSICYFFLKYKCLVFRLNSKSRISIT